MRTANVRFLLPTLVVFFLVSPELRAAPVDQKTVSLPITFETNLGQAAAPYQFLSRHGSFETLFSSSGIDLLFPAGKGRGRMRLRLLGTEHDVAPRGDDLLPSVTNYLMGADPSRWIRRVPNHSQVVYPRVYPGIDLVFHGTGNQMEHDFRIAPGTSPDQVRFSIEGAQKIAINSAGDLDISLSDETLVFQKPVAYQDSARGQQLINSGYVLNADGSVQFRIGAYDRTRELVIDPIFRFSTYLAGSTADNPSAVTTDAAGNVYVTGFTYSTDFPIVNGIETTFNGSPDVFISKLDPTGHTLLYSTYLGGSSRNYGNAIALDSQGNIIVAGTSGSNDFPHVGLVPALTCEGNNDCFFIASLKPDGSEFNYVGLIGGIEGTDVASGGSGAGVLALDASGNAYLASVTDDSHFQITPGTLATTVPGYPINSTFVLKVGKTGALTYSTIIPGVATQSITPYLTNVFIPTGISVNASGYATIAGISGPGLPSTAGVIQPAFPNDVNEQNASAGFVLQLNAKASAVNYATYVPGTDTIGGLATDSLGNSYVTGGTSETNLPVSSNAYQKTIKAGPNCTCNSGFVLKLNGTGTSVLAATYLEGTPASGNEGTAFSGIALDSHSNVFVGGSTASTDFPMVNPFVSFWVYGQTQGDMILAEMNPDLSSVLFGSFLSSTDQIFPASVFAGLSVGRPGNLVVVGTTSTTDFPTTPGSFQPTPPTQARHGFVTNIGMATAAASVCLDNWNVNFGYVPVKTSDVQIVHLTNCGNAPLTLVSVVSSSATVTVKDSCTTIPPKFSCPVTLTYSPKDNSTVVGTLTLKDNAVISPQILQFSGQGIAPQLSPSSGSDDFGHLLVNTQGLGNPLFFSNTGNAPLSITSASANGDFSVIQNGCKGTFQPGYFCVITVVFAPTAAGIRTGTLTIVSNDPVYPRAGISLIGTGDAVYAVPLIGSLGSPSVQIKNGPVTVTVEGTNFYPASVVEVNGTPQVTTYSNSGQLQATLDSNSTSAIGEVRVSVANPTPGGGTSVAVPLTRYQLLDLVPAFLATAPGSSVIYGSIPSSATVHPNTVIPISPLSGALGKAIPVGKNPGLLAASSDGAYLYVVLNQDQTVQRINLATKAVDRTFPFPPNNCSYCTIATAVDLKVIPGSPKEVVLALTGELALYNDAGLVNYVPTAESAAASFTSFAYAGNPTAVYSLPITDPQSGFLNVATIDAGGLHFTTPSGYGVNYTTGPEVVSDGTLLYTNAGEVWSPATQTQVGTFPVTNYNDTSFPNLYRLVMDVPGDHIFVLGFQPYLQSSVAMVLSAYNRPSLNLTGALAFPDLQIPIAQNLVRWGLNGFAFVGTSSSGTQGVVLLTSSLAAAAGANPIPHVAALTPRSISQGSTYLQLTLNGSGFTEGSVVMWNGSPLVTMFGASSILTAQVPASDIASSGTASITVTNPEPGGGVSNKLIFTISALTPMISFSASSLSFPAQTVGTSSQARTISLQNPGTATLNISGISIAGANPTSFRQTHNCGSTLPPGGNCSVFVVFQPISKGSLSALLKFADNAVASPQAVSLSGTGD